MTRASESGAYLGGIGTMLAQAEVCPHCGAPHHRARVGGSPSSDCPHVVFGTFPILTAGAEEASFDNEEPAPRAPAPQLPPSLPEPTHLVRRGSGVAILWPMPTEEYL